jgi:hypothetical protein
MAQAMAMVSGALGAAEEGAVAVAWWTHLMWVAAAAVIGFGVATIFAGRLGWSRRWFLVPHLLISGALVVGYWRWSGIELIPFLRDNWVWGVVGGALAGAFLVWNVMSQPASPASSGPAFVFDLFWLGGVYGLVDALLLSVLPIVATWQAFSALGWTDNWPGRVAVAALALIMSLAVTAAYHLGFPEFKGGAVVKPLIGNGASSLGYLLTTNPLGALLSHVAMHVAAVFHGPATTVQLPPHY